MTAYSIIKTKAGRAHVVKEVEHLCDDLDLNLTVENEDARTLAIRINRGNHHLMFDLEPRVLPEDCVLSWYSRGDAKYPEHFYGGDVNRFHYGKATAVVRDVEKLILTIRMGFEQLRAIEAAKVLLTDSPIIIKAE